MIVETKKALRYSEGKPDWTLLDFKALMPLVDGMTYGAKKYTRDNWQLPCDDPKQHIRSAFRHLIAIRHGEEIDAESGVRHSGLVMANMMMYNFHTDEHGNNRNSECYGKEDADGAKEVVL